MNLKNVSAKLSKDGSVPTIHLVNQKSQSSLQGLILTTASDKHKGFILSTWIRSYSAQARAQGNSDFYRNNESKIAESRWRDCVVATDEDGYTVYAWVCGAEGSLWHVYVIPELRNCRVATRLIEHACGKLEAYARPWPYAAHARINPYLLCEKHGSSSQSGNVPSGTEAVQPTDETVVGDDAWPEDAVGR